MKPQELRNLTKDELLSKEVQFKEELFKLNYQRKIGRVEKPHKFKLLRRDLARIHTIIKEQEIEANARAKK